MRRLKKSFPSRCKLTQTLFSDLILRQFGAPEERSDRDPTCIFLASIIAGAQTAGACGGGGHRSNRCFQKPVNECDPGQPADVRFLSRLRREGEASPSMSLSASLCCIVIVNAFTLQLARTKASELARGFSCYDRCRVGQG